MRLPEANHAKDGSFLPGFRSTRYANVAATLALLFSLAGTATAASITLVSGSQVKDGSLTGADLADNAIGASRLKVHSITAGYVQPGTLTGGQIRDGSLTLRDLSPTSLKTLNGQKGGDGAAKSIKLAAYAKTDPQTLPDDSSFHSAWSLHFRVAANQIFIVTGNIGGATTPGCSSGDSTYSERILLDGSNVLWEHDSGGATTGTQPGGFMTFAPGKHTLSYDVRGDCPGSPATVQGQDVAMIPFTLP